MKHNKWRCSILKLGSSIEIGQAIEVPNKGIKIYPLYYQGIHAREYKLIEEVEKDVDLIDSGSIDKVYIKNKSKYPIFVRAGNIISGKSQNRTIKRSILVTLDVSSKIIVQPQLTTVMASAAMNSANTFGAYCTGRDFAKPEDAARGGTITRGRVRLNA